jgi:hypothetical protein
MPSRFGLDSGALQRAPQRQNDAGLPTCTNCRNEQHNRCPTAITNHGVTGWTSDFECACYYADEAMHANGVESDNEEYRGSGDGDWSGGEYRPEGGGWTDWGR